MSFYRSDGLDICNKYIYTPLYRFLKRKGLGHCGAKLITFQISGIKHGGLVYLLARYMETPSSISIPLSLIGAGLFSIDGAIKTFKDYQKLKEKKAFPLEKLVVNQLFL